ncbi:MAG: FAD-dependent oxidoreductase [Candidatus Woesearchaeota archaeon]
MKVVIIGGGTLGTTCAFELRKQNKDIDITIIEKGKHLQYSPCALPYLISGEVKSMEDIFIFDRKDYTTNDIDLKLETNVIGVDRENKRVITESNEKYDYDYLVLGLGSSKKEIGIKGLSENAHTFNSLDDFLNFKDYVKNNSVKKISVIGSGLIGTELAFSLMESGYSVDLIEAKNRILPNLIESEISDKLESYFRKKGMNLYLDSYVKKVKKSKVVFDDMDLKSDMIFDCTGLRPNIDFAKKIGLKVNEGIVVDDYLRTNDLSIFAGGDCVESKNKILSVSEVSMLGTKAVKCAKIIAKNILDVNAKFKPFLNSTVSKIGDKFIGSIGINSESAKKNGLDVYSASYTSEAVSEYYDSDDEITYNIICDSNSKILGCQIISDLNVSGRVNTISVAIDNDMTIEELSSIETCYNPGSAPIFDPMTTTCEILSKRLKFMSKG